LGRQEEEEEVVGEDVREAMRLQIPAPFWALILLLEVGGVWDEVVGPGPPSVEYGPGRTP